MNVGHTPPSLTAGEMHYGPMQHSHTFLPTSLPSLRFQSLYIYVCIYMYVCIDTFILYNICIYIQYILSYMGMCVCVLL